ncbi:amidohydrolase family protein [Peribacillus simplex]|uniref:amidohydrolase family protein n=1 Tax=Peribacillus simplex TaxID=1478 RepID=UPI003999ACA5
MLRYRCPAYYRHSNGTINAAECFGLTEHGVIAPGFMADFLLLDDLDSVIIHSDFK